MLSKNKFSVFMPIILILFIFCPLSAENSKKLIKCIESNDIKSVKALLDNGIDVNFIDEEYFMSPLTLAVKNNNLALIKLLVNHGAILDLDQETSSTPLEYAAFIGNLEILNYLLKQGASPNFHQGATPVAVAAGNFHRDAVDRLIKAGADVNLAGNSGITPLISCSLQSVFKCRKIGYKTIKEVIKLLLENGADINHKTNSGLTALQSYCHNAPYDMIKFFLDNGADVGVKDKMNYTALHSAVFRHRPNLKITELLIKNGANLNVETQYGRTPLSKAIINYCLLEDKNLQQEQFKIILLLINSGADLNHINKDGLTPLDYIDRSKFDDLYDILMRLKKK